MMPLLSVALVLTLTACSSQMAYRDGQRLLEENKIADGLQKLKQASTTAPDNAQYKISYISKRDAATQKILSRADAELSASKTDLALQSFREVLAYDAVNERALQGIRLIDMANRHEKQISQAQISFEKKEFEVARLKLTAILAENPSHEKARSLLANVNEKLWVNARRKSGCAI